MARESRRFHRQTNNIIRLEQARIHGYPGMPHFAAAFQINGAPADLAVPYHDGSVAKRVPVAGTGRLNKPHLLGAVMGPDRAIGSAGFATAFLQKPWLGGDFENYCATMTMGVNHATPTAKRRWGTASAYTPSARCSVHRHGRVGRLRARVRNT